MNLSLSEPNEQNKLTIKNINPISPITISRERWYMSTNAKDIGTLYLIFALFSGLLGSAFSVLIRIELSGPGVQYIADNQLYNSIITAHALLMIFFMVNKRRLSNRNFHTSTLLCNNISNDVQITYNNNNNNDNKDNNNNDNNNNDNNNKNVPLMTKIFIEDAINNRKAILKISKKQKGVYVWENGKDSYVGNSINLYNRVNSYFMPSILKTKARRVLRYFNKYGFNKTNLTLYIIDENSSLEQVVKLEQYLIDTLKPNLKWDLVAKGSGYHEPISKEMKDKLRKLRGTPVYMYSLEDFTLLHIFFSKQQWYEKIKIHHSTLNGCLNAGLSYLNSFYFSLDVIKESNLSNLLTLQEIITLVSSKREIYFVKHPAMKNILAQFKNDDSKNLTFSSLNSLSIHLKGDREVIRSYLKGAKPGYYRGKWKFTYKD